MTGGLLQIVTSGKQDIYLTINPEITFFKKVYRRHTNFSVELIKVNSENASEFNNITSFIINNGDAINRCYIELQLPNLVFPDTFITNPEYINKKTADLNNLQLKYNDWLNYYTNLLGYVNIEVNLYRILYNFLQTDNITINTLQNQVSQFNFVNKNAKDQYINKINKSVFILIDISGYINSINLLITNEIIIDTTKYINSKSILDKINSLYQNMNNYLNYYHSKYIFYYQQYTNKLSGTNINFNYAQYLGHNIFDYISLEIGGQEFIRYSNNVLHINQMHNITSDNMDNYLDMIGHTPELYTFNSDAKGNRKILIPLIFWFNKDTGSSLPLVGLQYSTIVVNIKLKNIGSFICFENYEQMFTDMLTITINNTTTFILNKNLIYKDYKFNISDKSITYKCVYINNELLLNKFPDLSDSEISTILITNGTKYTLNQITKLLYPGMSDIEISKKNGKNGDNTQFIINQMQWVRFMINIKNPIYTTLASKVGSYYPYINFNMFYSLVPQPTLSLITEVIYLDDIEREKFADSKLEYVIETFNEDVYTITSLNYFDCELSFIKPCKELLWYLQPQIFYDGLTSYGQNTSLLYDNSVYFINNPILSQSLTLNHIDVLIPKVDINYYTFLLSYKYLNNTLPNGIYYNSFCLYPEETQPSGSVNLTVMKGKQYRFQFNSNFVNEINSFVLNLNNPSMNINRNTNFTLRFISKSYDLFIVNKGSANLLFT
jgi:hypothetical protein